MAVLVIFAGEAAGAPRWLRLAGGAVAAQGEGYPTAQAGDDGNVAVVVAAADVALHRAEFGGLAPAQAQAAALLVATDASITPLETLHVVAGGCVAVIARDRMAALIEDAQAHGFDPDLIIPAPLLLPAPDTGFVRGRVGDEWVVRGAGGGFGDDPALTPLMIGDGAIETISGDALERAVAAALDEPTLNLRQGVFAQRRDWTLNRPALARMARIAAAIGVLALMIPLVTIARLNQQSAAFEQNAGVLAQAALGGNARPETAEAQLEAALADLRGGGAGFVPTATAVIAAVEQTANVELVAMAFDADGTMRITARASTSAELGALQRHIHDAGFVVTVGPVTSNQGQPLIDMEVRGS